MTSKWWLVFILVMGLQLRLTGLHSSLTDWHSFRQVDTASVSLEYVKNGIDLLRPRYHDLSNIASGRENPEGYRMVEMPFVNGLIALIVRTIPETNVVVVSRLVSILASLGTIICLFVLGKRLANETVGLLAAMFFSLMPYAVFYSRVVLPEPVFTFLLTAAITTFFLWTTEKKLGWYLLSWISFALALLLKPFAIFFTPILLHFAVTAFRQRILLQPLLYCYAGTMAPFFAWRWWIQRYPEGIAASNWLFNSLDGLPIRLKPAWFRWLGWERVTKLILGGAGVVLAAFFWTKKNALVPVLLVWGGCVTFYFVLIAAGNVRHDYYQVLTLPFFSLLFAQGAYALSQMKSRTVLAGALLLTTVVLFGIYWVPIPAQPVRTLIPPTALLALIFSAGFLIATFFYKKANTFASIVVATALIIVGLSLNQELIRGYYRTRPDWQLAGESANALLPKDALVIAHAMGDTTLLFQTQRKGWPIGFDIEKKRALGAQYYISTSYDDEARALEQQYTLIEKTPNHIILDLTAPRIQTSPAQTQTPL